MSETHDELRTLTLIALVDSLTVERDRLRKDMESAYKISVCYFPGTEEVEATWEDAEGTVAVATFHVDAATGDKLAAIVPPGVYHKAIAIQDAGL